MDSASVEFLAKPRVAISASKAMSIDLWYALFGLGSMGCVFFKPIKVKTTCMAVVLVLMAVMWLDLVHS